MGPRGRQALEAALARLADERFWRGQPPHFGSQAAGQLAGRAQALAAERLSGLALAERLQGLSLPGAGAPPAWSAAWSDGWRGAWSDGWNGAALQERLQGLAQARDRAGAPPVGGPLGPNRVAACRAQACTSAYAVVRGLGCLVGLVVATGWRALRQAASARAEGAGAALAAALTAKPGAAPSGADAGADGLAGLAPHFGTHAGLDAARALADKAGAAAAELGFHGLDLRALAPAEGPLRELAAAAAGAAAAAAAAPAAAAAALAGWQPDQAAAAAAGAASAFAASLQDAGAHARWQRAVQNREPCSAAVAARRLHTDHI